MPERKPFIHRFHVEAFEPELGRAPDWHVAIASPVTDALGRESWISSGILSSAEATALGYGLDRLMPELKGLLAAEADKARAELKNLKNEHAELSRKHKESTKLHVEEMQKRDSAVVAAGTAVAEAADMLSIAIEEYAQMSGRKPERIIKELRRKFNDRREARIEASREKARQRAESPAPEEKPA